MSSVTPNVLKEQNSTKKTVAAATTTTKPVKANTPINTNIPRFGNKQSNLFKLKENQDSAQKSAVPANVKAGSSHHASHVNVHNNVTTPKTQAINKALAFGSSTKKEVTVNSSATKKPSNAHVEAKKSIATLFNAAPQGKSTPSTRATSTTANGRANAPADNTFGPYKFDVNPIWNGTDYTEQMLKKAQYGSTGPGYIVEFKCDPKWFRGFFVPKGLYRVLTDDKNNFNELIGPFLRIQRIDVSDEKTPMRTNVLPRYDFSVQVPANLTASASKTPYSMLNTSRSAESLFPNCSSGSATTSTSTTTTAKKTVRLQINATEMERITEQSSACSSQATTPHHSTTTITPHRPSGPTPAAASERSNMRRSYSCSDMSHVVIKGCGGGDESLSSKTCSSFLAVTKIMNETYDKAAAASPNFLNIYAQSIVLNVSPKNIVNSSFIDGGAAAHSADSNLLRVNLDKIVESNNNNNNSISSVNSSSSLLSQVNQNNNHHHQNGSFVVGEPPIGGGAESRLARLVRAKVAELMDSGCGYNDNERFVLEVENAAEFLAANLLLADMEHYVKKVKEFLVNKEHKTE